MNGLLLKEFFTLKRYILSYVTVLVMFLFISIYMGSISYFQSMTSMSLGMLTLTGMTYDKMFGWDKMVLTLPYKRNKIVLSKYICCVMVSALSLIFSTVVGMTVSMFVPISEETITDVILMAIILFGLLVLAYAIILPLVYKLGVEKARYFMILSIMVPVFVFLSIYEYVPETLKIFIETHFAITGIMFLGLVAICYIISYRISVAIYKSKEF